MEKRIFATMLAEENTIREVELLAASIREGAGETGQIWVMIPRERGFLSGVAKKILEEQAIRALYFDAPQEAFHFYYAVKVFAAGAAEEAASGIAEELIWMDSDTIFLRPPVELDLPAGKTLGYRPVMLKNISSRMEDEIDPYWAGIYTACGVLPNRITAMQTSVDQIQIRPQFNAGLLVVRPERKILRMWRSEFERLFRQSAWTPFFEKHVLYHIFFHQAVLAGVILAHLEPDEMLCLSERYNYPVFLQQRIPEQFRAKSLDELFSVRYDEFEWFSRPDWDTVLPGSQVLIDWLRQRLSKPMERTE